MNDAIESQGERKDVVSVDLWNAGYSVTFSDHRLHPENNQITRQSPDALVTKEGVDYVALSRRALFTVNGLIHPVSAADNGLYILDGNRNIQQEGTNHASIIDFGALGQIKTYPIQSSFIWKDTPTNLVDGLFITFPEVNFSTQTVFFVLGGYLLPIHDLYRVISDATIRLDLHDYPLVQRFLESRNRIDLSEISDNELIAPEALYTDDNIIKLLTNKHSFIVVLDAEDVAFEEKMLETTSLPGRYRSGLIPRGILHHADGTIGEYILHGSDSDVSIISRYTPQKPLRYATMSTPPQVVDDSRHPMDTLLREVPYLLSIYQLA